MKVLESLNEKELIENYTKQNNCFFGIEVVDGNATIVCMGEGNDLINALATAMTQKPHLKGLLIVALSEVVSI